MIIINGVSARPNGTVAFHTEVGNINLTQEFPPERAEEIAGQLLLHAKQARVIQNIIVEAEMMAEVSRRVDTLPDGVLEGTLTVEKPEEVEPEKPKVARKPRTPAAKPATAARRTTMRTPFKDPYKTVKAPTRTRTPRATPASAAIPAVPVSPPPFIPGSDI